MRIIRTPRAFFDLGESWRSQGKKVGFVPTMGALHEAHLSLIRKAKKICGRVVVSVFVNPLQFGPKEDLTRYPRPFRKDAALCRAEGADALYHPSPAVFYPKGFKTIVDLPELSGLYCGADRPGHFRGVATVLTKFLGQLKPDVLFLGEKDYQQLFIVRRMVEDLDLGVKVVGCPIVRAPDGLALSSRNVFLSPEEREAAPGFNRALREAARSARGPGATPKSVVSFARSLLRKIPGASLDYAVLVDADSLLESKELEGKKRLLAAIRFKKARLIDNMPISSTSDVPLAAWKPTRPPTKSPRS